MNEITRRKILFGTTAVTGAAIIGLSGFGLLYSMFPTANIKYQSEGFAFDLANIPVGVTATILVYNTPIFLRHLTDKEIADTMSVKTSQLFDQNARNVNLPADAEATFANRTFGRFAIFNAICPRLGCIPLGDNLGVAGDYGGWFCPCGAAHFDPIGRVRKGPSPENLSIPRYEIISETKIAIHTDWALMPR